MMQLLMATGLGMLVMQGARAEGEGAASLSAARQRELVHLVRQDCGSCHGMNLTGGLGTPLTPERLRDMSEETLVSIIMLGRPGTAMPPWKSLLSEKDAEWIVRKLKAGFPEEGLR